MTRAYLKLYFLLILPILAIALLPQNPLNLLTTWWAEELAHKEYGAIYPLIKEELAPYPKEEWPNVVNKISEHFAYRLELKTHKESALKASVLSHILNKGYGITYYKGNKTLVYAVKATDYLLLQSLESKTTDNDSFEKASRGFRYLLRKRSLQSGDTQKEFDRVKKYFKQELTLTKMEDFTGSNEIRVLLQKSKSYNESKEGYFYNYILSDDKKYLITVKSEKSRKKFSRYYRYLSTLFPAILLAIGLIIWLALFRKELKILKTATKQLGQGLFETRTQLSKSSTLYPIANSFNDMASHIQTLVEGHQDLTNAVSHELKTPLSRLHFALEMQKESKSDEERKQYTEKIESNIIALERLVNELLSYSRMQRKPEAKLTKQSLKKWLDTELLNFKKYHPNVDINVDFQGDNERVFDSHLLSRALNNILDNAVVYRKTHNTIIHIKVSQNNEQSQLSIEDNGIGIKPEDFKKIFEPFTRLDKSRQRKENESLGGYGMGLAIVKSILIQHKGEVSCEKSSLGGTKITLCWPNVVISNIN